MKKFLLLFLVFFLSASVLFSDNLQLVMPKIIYIGDTVEIHYVFHSEAKAFSGNFSDSPACSLNLNTNYDFFRANDSDFTVKTARLEKVNAEYTLTLTIIPWKTGLLQIPPFNLNSLVNSSMDFAVSKKSPVFTPFIISLSPIEVKSLVTKTKNKSFMPQSAPLVMSGTTGFLAILAVGAFFLFSLIVFILLHIPRVGFFLRNLSRLYFLKKNSRRAIKKLRRLQKESDRIPSDKDFSEKIQHIVRKFLQGRFNRDFSSITTGSLYNIFTDLCGGELEESQDNTVEKLISIFSRLDYIRFSEKASFLNEAENGGTRERFSIITAAVTLIEDFDESEN